MEGSGVDDSDREKQRAHKKRQRARRKAEESDLCKDTLEAIRGPLFERFARVESVPMSVEWSEVPTAIDPVHSLGDNERGHRKRAQVQSFAAHLQRLIDSAVRRVTAQQMPSKRCVVVDFGAGSGNAALPLAWIFRHVADFVFVERFEVPANLMRQKAAAAGMQHVRVVQSLIADFKETFDVGTALHACGSASDDALQRCLDVHASALICSCCVGKLKFAENQPLPRSAFVSKYVDRESFLTIVKAADHSDFASASEEALAYKRECKMLVELDRLSAVQEQPDLKEMYECFVGKLTPTTCSPKHDVIIVSRK